MRARAIRAVAFSACLAASLPSLPAEPAPSPKLFDGMPRLFVVNG